MKRTEIANKPIHELLEDGLLQTPQRLGCLSNLELPGGWHLHHHMETSGRRLIEIYDVSRDLVGFVASTDQPLVSIGAAWRGLTREADGDRRWRTLAIGHANLHAQPCVTFTSRTRDRRLLRTIVTPVAIDGLWVLMVSGRQTTVSLRQGCQRVGARRSG
jgi:hypothetical protein